jgi:chlorite dismutase
MALWRICYSVDDLSEMMAELLATPLGGYLQLANNYIAMTKRSQYLIGHEHEGQHDSRGAIRPGGQKYIFIYPFWKTPAPDDRAHPHRPPLPAGQAQHHLLLRHR